MPADHPIEHAQVGRCRIDSRIGSGGMGVVYKARHTDLDLDVAVKFLHPHLVQQRENAERFLREARLAARLNHPGIVRVFDCGESEGRYFIVMEFVGGQTLSDHIRERRRLSVSRALQIAESVAGALSAALDEAGMIHRDIKPDNILLTPSGQPKLADLGLAKIVAGEGGHGVTMTGTCLGTPSYMSPEQISDAGHVDHRTDIYSLGATLYHMLTGEPPFTGETLFAVLRRVQESPAPPLPASVPQRVSQVVHRMLAKRAQDRFADYAALIAELRRCQDAPGDSSQRSGETVIAADQPTPSLVPPVRIATQEIRPASPTENRVLLVVDIQNDFCPGGALAVPGGDEVVPVINKLARRFAHVILTQDWHCEDHLSFASSHPGKSPMDYVELSYGPQILWPDHCVEGTPGADFHPELVLQHCELVIRKGYHREIDSYSAFFENDRQTPTGLAGYLRERGLSRLFLVGLATDFCVAYSAIDARRLGFEVTMIESGCRGIDVDGSLAAAWKEMEEAGVIRA